MRSEISERSPTVSVPNRSAEHALAQCYAMVQKRGLHYVVDIDIKGFFDNVSHGKLLKQMWNMGIQDKRVLSIISAMLKAEVAGIGFPQKGTPQGGIISPLLSNIVLNELDWWIASQWENMPTRKNREYARSDNGVIDKSQKYEMLRKGSALKECYIVRYADELQNLLPQAKRRSKTLCRYKRLAKGNGWGWTSAPKSPELSI